MIQQPMISYYRGYAQGMLEDYEPRVCDHGRHHPHDDGFLEYVEARHDRDILDTRELWDMYLGHIEALYRAAFRKAFDGYILNAYEHDSEEWASKITWAELVAAAWHHAEAEWTEYL